MECMQLLAGGTQFVRCREVVCSSDCPLLEVPLYIKTLHSEVTAHSYYTFFVRIYILNITMCKYVVAGQDVPP